jgi:CRP-like cAMP-binding protein
MFIVGQGKVAVLLKKKGKLSKVAELGAGKFFGEMSVMTGEPRAASIRAMEECEIIVVDQLAFHRIIEKNASVLEEMSEILATRHNQLDAARSEGVRSERTTESGILLRRIRSFFSNRPSERKA